MATDGTDIGFDYTQSDFHGGGIASGGPFSDCQARLDPQVLTTLAWGNFSES